jgi:uncharacterized surface protein with fasciclin (FAS1) repeats
MKTPALVTALTFSLVTLPYSAHAGSCGSHSSASASPHADRPSIVETAVAAGVFHTLTAALTEAELVEALNGHGPFTVFAPTDEAFAKLPKGTVEELLKPENREQLVDILTYHVVAAELTAEKVTSSKGAEALNGQQLSFTTDDGAVRIDSAAVTEADILCSNGVIHVIDTVLIPSRDDVESAMQGVDLSGTLLATR